MKSLEEIEIEMLKEDGYSDEEINMIDYYQSTKKVNKRSCFYAPFVNFLFGDNYVRYNLVYGQMEIYTRFGLVSLPTAYEILSLDRNRTKYAFNTAYKIKSILHSDSFYDEFFSFFSNENLRNDCEDVVNSRYDVYYSSTINLTVDGYNKILNLIDKHLDDIQFDDNMRLPFNFYDIRYCILDAIKKKLNLEYTEELKIYLGGE